MNMKKILWIGTAILFAQFALAKMPFNNDVFGRAEGALDYCAQSDPPAAEKYQEKKKGLVKDVPVGEVAQARETKEYKKAYEWMSDALAKMPKDEVSKACTAVLESKN